MGKTSIEWTEFSVNPIRARHGRRTGHYCEKVSPGCTHCYASRMQPRFGLPQFQDQRLSDVRTFLDASTLLKVLSRKKPTTYFWCDMSDMFGEWVPNEWIAACFGVMSATPQHRHQVLTKRAKRLPVWFDWLRETVALGRYGAAGDSLPELCRSAAVGYLCDHLTEHSPLLVGYDNQWPLPNVHLGVSVEDQPRAMERIPYLLATPAAVRFISAEPLLGPLEIVGYLSGEYAPEDWGGAMAEAFGPSLDWVIVGAESGPSCRPCNVNWIRELVRQCRQTQTAVFVKQLGGRVFAPWKLEWTERLDGSFDLFSSDGVGVKGCNLATVWPTGSWHTWDAYGIGGENDTEDSVQVAKREAVTALQRQHLHPIKGWNRHAHMLRHSKGADPSEWPAELRVREMPSADEGDA